jgi:outer membrane protein, multidrug efflux system
MTKSAVLTLILASLAGCTLGPDYARPDIDTPAAWRIEDPGTNDLASSEWWRQFNDPALDTLVEESLRGNLDVRIAAARVDQFLGALNATRSQLYPQIGYGAEASRAQASRVGQPPLPPGADPFFSLYQASLGTAWQVDLFGRVRRLGEAAQAQVYASEQAQRGVVLTLVGNVAASYIGLRALDRQLEIAKATSANFNETARIFDLRFKAGIVSKTEVMQITSQAQQAKAAIPAFEQAIAAQENLISILLGRNPGPIARGKTIDQLVTPQIPSGLPSTLLSRRPDILQAEQNLVAANANVGAAKALYFPNISITGLLGSVSTAFSDLFTDPASAMFIGAGVTGPVFTFGGIKGQVKSAEAQKQQALLVYRLTVLNAFRETDDALTGSLKKASEVAEQQKRVDALREFARLSKLRFEKGMTGYLDVLVAENELFSADLAAVRLRADKNIQVINVYRAMGGAWVDASNKLAADADAAAAARGSDATGAVKQE